MKKSILQISINIVFTFILLQVNAQSDTLVVHNLGHASLMFEFNNLIIHVDPRNSEADYSALPDADLIFITHQHGDHYDLDALNQIQKESTLLIYYTSCKGFGILYRRYFSNE